MIEILATICYLAVFAVMVLACWGYARLDEKMKTAHDWRWLWMNALEKLLSCIVVCGVAGLVFGAIDMARRCDVWSPTVLLGVTVVATVALETWLGVDWFEPTDDTLFPFGRRS